MCQMASFVLTRDRVFFSKEGDSHEIIIKENRLHPDPDGVRGRPDIVRVKIVPHGDRYDLPLDRWVYQVDQELLPDWYDPARDETRTRKALVEWADHHIVRGGVVSIGNRQTRILLGDARSYWQLDGHCYCFDDARSHGQKNGYCVCFDDAQSHGQKGGCCGCFDDAQSHGQKGGDSYCFNDAQSHGQQGGDCYCRNAAQSHGQQGGRCHCCEDAQSHGQQGGYCHCSEDAQSHGQQGGECYCYEDAQSHGQQGGHCYFRDRADSHGQRGGTCQRCGDAMITLGRIFSQITTRLHQCTAQPHGQQDGHCNR